MDFRTKIKISKSSFSVPPFEDILCVGSCFADNIGRKFKEEKFRITTNPYGVMYNPVSIFHTIKKCENAPRIAILTLGTNHVYILKATGEIVDNCKKMPQVLFDEKELSIDECVDFLSQAVDLLTERCANVKIILTVSPIRYAKYGFHGSQLSKATLLLAADIVVKKYGERVVYFPAYELINDELRDYRFYKSDMIHPSEQAVEYVWERFQETFFNENTLKFIAEWRPIKESLNHKPFDSEAQEYKDFMEKIQQKIAQLKVKYPELEV